MNKILNLFLLSLILFSCNTKQANKTTDKASLQAALAPLQITVIANLHDSLQPKIISLDSMPKPLMITIPNKSEGFYSITPSLGEAKKINLQPPINKPFPVLQNQKGEPILDPAGKPFILGNGGMSNFTTFNTDDGLALDGINCSIMDKSGNLWFGTSGGGVSKYDGKSFTNFTTAQGLAHNVVWSILEDKSGNLWFGTFGGGISKYDGKSFTSFTKAQGLADNIIFSITEDKSGNLWFGTWNTGVSKYDGKSFTHFTTDQGLADNNIRGITEDKSGNLWFSTFGGGVSKYDGKSFTSFTTAQGLINNYVRSITEDKYGNLWFGTNEGVSKYDGKSFTSFTTAQGLVDNEVLCITEDKSGNLWFGTNGGGISKYDGKSFISFTTAQGLANNEVYSILEDKSGNLWFGTFGGGVSKYGGKSFMSFTTAQGLVNNVIFSMIEDKSENLWLGTVKTGVSKYDGESFTSFTTAQGLPSNDILCVNKDKSGNLWFGTYGKGVSKYDGKSFTNFTKAQGLPSNSFWCITEDKSGNLWFGTWDAGVSKYDGKSFTHFTTTQGLTSNQVMSIVEDKSGNLWFGTKDKGVSKYDGKSFINFTTAQGLVNNAITNIKEDKNGNLWFGTNQGLSILDAETVRNKLTEIQDKLKGEVSSNMFKNFNMSDGLPDNNVTNILQLPDGRMAVGTNLGITLFNISTDLTKLKDIEIYNTNTGYPIKDVNTGQNCMFLDSKGIIWAGTGSEKTGWVRFDYSALEKHTAAPTLVIQSVKVKDENICWYNLETKGIKKNSQDSSTALLQEFFAFGKTLSPTQNDSLLKRFGNIQFDSITKFYPLPQNLVLPYAHNQVSFEFAVIETDRPFLVKYQYMLEGYDKDWRPITDKSHANFGNINEGTYTFKVKGQAANGLWSAPVIYTFKVLPPWYRTWWAYTIYVLMFLLVLRFFIQWRERNLQMEKEKLEHIVEVRTAEVVAEKKEVEKQKEEAEKQRKRSDDLLLNILPEEVAEELKAKGSADAKSIDDVTVLFTDFKGFTQLSEKLTPQELVGEINECFSAFDHIMQKHGVEKIKTIGDAYMAAGGLPTANKTHAQDVVNAALDIQKYMQKHKATKEAEGKLFFEIRIGVHTGPVIAGIVGIKKFAYDIWGDTVNTASRMESSGEIGKVNISGITYAWVKDTFVCTHRGKISAKNKGEIEMYFVEKRIE